MAINKVKEYFKEKGIEERIIELNESSATVADAACALHTIPDQIAKSLSFIINDKPVIIVVAGEHKINNSKFKIEFHEKAKMIPYEDVEGLIGHAVGGVCPFGINHNVDVYLDKSLKKHQTVFPACGSSSSAIELSIKELEEYSNYLKWIDVAND